MDQKSSSLLQKLPNEVLSRIMHFAEQDLYSSYCYESFGQDNLLPTPSLSNTFGAQALAMSCKQLTSCARGTGITKTLYFTMCQGWVKAMKKVCYGCLTSKTKSFEHWETRLDALRPLWGDIIAVYDDRMGSYRYPIFTLDDAVKRWCGLRDRFGVWPQNPGVYEYNYCPVCSAQLSFFAELFRIATVADRTLQANARAVWQAEKVQEVLRRILARHQRTQAT